MTITRRRQVLGTILVMTGTFVSAIDLSVVGTAMPTVIGELGGIDRYAWVFSAYILMSTVATPLFGRLADMFGRKRIYFGALVTFIAFSMLCGTAQTLDQLIVYRALQGFAAGALLPTGFTIIGDLYSRESRAKVSGLTSSVWVGAAIIGPAVGGFLTQALSWRWVFYVNLPVGLIALALLVFGYRDTGEHHRQPIDWRGAITFAAAATSLMLGLNGVVPLALLPASILLGVLFVRIESRTEAPIIDLDLVRDPLIGAALAMTAAAGVIQFGASTFVPPFVQGAQGGQPAEAGAALGAMSVGWSGGSTLIGWVLIRAGIRRVVIVGSMVLVAGALGFLFFQPSTPIIAVAVAAFLIGVGMGWTSSPILVTVQTSVGYRQRGAATSLVQFARTLGGTVGLAALGSIFTATLGGHAAQASALLDPIARRDLDQAAIESVRGGLTASLHAVFLLIVVVALLGTVLARRLPREMPSDAERKVQPLSA